MEPYSFDLSDPSSWRNFPAPYLNPRYIGELSQLGGQNLYGEDILRFEWGGSALEEIDGQPGLKYHLCTTPKRFTGVGKVKGVLRPCWQATDIGIPRWFVARWQSPEKSGDEWPRGRYVYFLRIEQDGARYSDINDFWMQRIREHYHYTINRTDDEYAAEIKAATFDINPNHRNEEERDYEHHI